MHGHDDANDRGDEPSVVTSERSSSQRNAAGFQRAVGFHLRRRYLRFGVGKTGPEKLIQIDQRPDEERQEDGLVHRGGLQVEQIWIERVNRGREVGDNFRGAAAHQAKDTERAEHISHHAGNGSCDPTAPQRVVPHERQHGNVLQRKPHRSQFCQRLQRMAVVHHAARDVDMRDRIAVKQAVPALCNRKAELRSRVRRAAA